MEKTIFKKGDKAISKKTGKRYTVDAMDRDYCYCSRYDEAGHAIIAYIAKKNLKKINERR